MEKRHWFSVVALLLSALIAMGSYSVSHYWGSRRSRYTIGLVYVPSRAFAEYVNNALIDLIKADGRFAIKEFTAPRSSDLNLVSMACDEALASNADLLITTGLHCTKGAITTAKKRQSSKPIVFMGTLNVVKNGFVNSIEQPGGTATGIETNSPFATTFNALDLLKVIKPRTRSVLLPYAQFSAETLERHAEALQAAAKKNRIAVTLLPINQLLENQMNEILSQTAGFFPGHDALFYLEGDSIAACGAGFGKLASGHGITMVASSIDGAESAALSYAADPQCLPLLAFDMAKEILINKKDPAHLPVVLADVPRNLSINTRLCKEQGLENSDIAAAVQRIRQDARFAAVHDHIIVDGLPV